MRTKHLKKAPAQKGLTHTISPTQAEFLMAIWNRRGATAPELAEAMDTSVGMIRRLAMLLSRSSPAYIQRQISSEATVTAEGRKITATFTRYYLIEDSFAQWPRDAVFLLDAGLLLNNKKSRRDCAYNCSSVCREVHVDENGTISISEFKAHLKARHGYTEKMFDEDWSFLVPRQYVYEYGDRFSPGIRIDAEEQWLLLLLRQHNPPQGVNPTVQKEPPTPPVEIGNVDFA